MTRKQPKQPRVWEVPVSKGGAQTLFYENDKMFTTTTPNEVPHEAVYLREYIESQYRPNGSYVHPPERGTDDLDITSYHPDQRTWAGAKADRPDVLFQYDKRGLRTPDHPLNLLLDLHDRIIIDAGNHPVRHFEVLPITISSKVEGWRMEAWMRLDSRITYEDLRARMVIKPLVSEDGQTEDMRPKNNALNMRKKRARGEMRCQAWVHHKTPTHFDILLALEMTGQMRADNSTRQLTDLTSDEQKLLKHTEYGSGFSKAGKQGFTQWVRDSRWQNVGVMANVYAEIPNDNDIDRSRFTLRWERIRGLDFRVVERKSNGQTDETDGQFDGEAVVETPLVSRSLPAQRSGHIQAPITNHAHNSSHHPQSSDAIYTQTAPVSNPLVQPRTMNVLGRCGYQVEFQQPGAAYSDRNGYGDFASQYGYQVVSQQPVAAYSDPYGCGNFTGPDPWIGANPPISGPSKYPAAQGNSFLHAIQDDSGYGSRTRLVGDGAEHISKKRRCELSEENEQVGQQYLRGGAIIGDGGHMMSSAFPGKEDHVDLNVKPFDRQKRPKVQPESEGLTSASQEQLSSIHHRGIQHETLQSGARNHLTRQARRQTNTRSYQMPRNGGQSDLNETVLGHQVDEFSRNSDALFVETDEVWGVDMNEEVHHLEFGPANVDTRSMRMNHSPTVGSGGGNTNDTATASPSNRLDYGASGLSFNGQHDLQVPNHTTLQQTMPPIALPVPRTHNMMSQPGNDESTASGQLIESSHGEGWDSDDEVISTDTIEMLTEFIQSQLPGESPTDGA